MPRHPPCALYNLTTQSDLRYLYRSSLIYVSAKFVFSQISLCSFQGITVQKHPAQKSLRLVPDGNILRKNTPIKQQIQRLKLINVPSGARRNLNLSSTLCQGLFKKVFLLSAFCVFKGRKSSLALMSETARKRIAAATYFPTQSPVQYHRRTEA